MFADAYYSEKREAAFKRDPGNPWPEWHELSIRERDQWRREARAAVPEPASCELPDDKHLYPELEPHDP
jgi:hypothetical protein